MNIVTLFIARIFVFSFLVFTILSCKKDETCDPAPAANAGSDQNVIGTLITLSANVPESGVGNWSIVSGEEGEFADALNATSTFTGVLGNTYVLKWTISGCPISEDEVQITFSCDPASAANAGADQTVTGTSATLAANATTGSWTIVSGAGGTVTEPSNPTSGFTGTIGTVYVLRWTVACPPSQDEVQITLISTDPQFFTIDRTNAVNGEIFTITGANFSSNYQGGSQINSIKTADPLIGQEVYLTILSRTSTQIKAVVIGTGGGVAGAYSLRYNKKTDTGAATLFPSSLTLTVISPTASQFYTSSTFTATNLAKGSEASFGVKNGSIVASDYTVKLIQYNYTTGVATEYDVTNVTVTALGYGGTMDKVAFTLPASLPSAQYNVKVTYGGATLIGGWGSSLNVF
jgi:hypothetical protein